MTERPGDLVEVEWVDSMGHAEWHEPDEARELLDMMDSRLSGYLVVDDERGIIVTQGTGELGKWLNSMAIPRAAIVSLTRLTPSKKVAT
jgi:hypothetical protein